MRKMRWQGEKTKQRVPEGQLITDHTCRNRGLCSAAHCEEDVKNTAQWDVPSTEMQWNETSKRKKWYCCLSTENSQWQIIIRDKTWICLWSCLMAQKPKLGIVKWKFPITVTWNDNYMLHTGKSIPWHFLCGLFYQYSTSAAYGSTRFCTAVLVNNNNNIFFRRWLMKRPGLLMHHNCIQVWNNNLSPFVKQKFLSQNPLHWLKPLSGMLGLRASDCADSHSKHIGGNQVIRTTVIVRWSCLVKWSMQIKLTDLI